MHSVSDTTRPTPSTAPWTRRTSCGSYEYTCNNGYCVYSWDVCDGTDDCGDYSDELYCGMLALYNRPFYSSLLSCLAFEWKWGWRWPCFDRNDAVLMLISRNLHMKSSKASIKTRSTPASLSFKGQATKHTTVKWSIGLILHACVYVRHCKKTHA